MNKQSGFTLIEIVMVLVLLGILSAVAVPKYFDLQEQAKLRAAQAAVAEAQARVNAVFADQLLKGKACTAAVEEAVKSGEGAQVNGVAMGDWTVSFEDDGQFKSVTRANGTATADTIDLTQLKKLVPQIVVPECGTPAIGSGSGSGNTGGGNTGGGGNN